MLALRSGYNDEALTHAKRGIKFYQRNWAILENRYRSKPISAIPENTESDVEALTEELAKTRIDSRSPPPVTSMTHEKLKGPAFWPLISSLVSSLLQLADVYSHMGLFQESVYYGEQAEKIACAVQADALLLRVRAKISVFWSRCHRQHEAHQLLEKLGLLQGQPNKTRDMVLYHQSMARLSHLRGEEEAELEWNASAISTLEEMMSSSYIDSLGRLQSGVAELGNAVDEIQLNDDEKPKKSIKTSRARKPQPKSTANSLLKTKRHQSPECQNESNPECPLLARSLSTFLAEKVVKLLLQAKASEACEVLLDAQKLLTGIEDVIPYGIANFKNLLVQALDLLSSDFTLSILPESTISFPAISQSNQITYEILPDTGSSIAPRQKRVQSRSRSPIKGGRKAALSNMDFITVLQQAKDCISEVNEKALRLGNTSVLHDLGSMLGHVAMLLSIIGSDRSNNHLQPIFIAQSLGKLYRYICLLVIG